MSVADYYSPTESEILAGYLRDIALEIPGAEVREGSNYYATGSVLAKTLLPVYANGAYLAREALPDLATEKGLARWAFVTQVQKLGAQYAEGSVAAVWSVATPIPDGTLLINRANGQKYKTVGVTTPGDAIYVIAVTPGLAGNALPGTTLEFLSVPPGISPTVMVVSLSGGDDAWNSARWADEILRRLRAKPGSGNVPHIQSICRAVPGVEEAFVYPALRGSGTLDIVLTTSAATGTRAAGKTLLARAAAALRFGIRPAGGQFIAGIPLDVFANTSFAAVIEQATPLVLAVRASKVTPFGSSWPPKIAATVSPTLSGVYKTVGMSPSLSVATVAAPLVGTPVQPVVGAYVGIYFPSVGFVKARIEATSTSGAPWTVTFGAWSTTPTELRIPAGAIIAPWSDVLPRIGEAVATYFARLGPGEMTPLTSDDITRRCRWPRMSDTNPITGAVEWPTDVGGRLIADVYSATDVTDVSLLDNGATFTPAVPAAPPTGTPPSILTLATLAVAALE